MKQFLDYTRALPCISDKRDRFHLVSDTEILETDQEFRFFSASLSNNFFCIAGRDCYCLVFDVTCPSAPKCEPIWLGERMVIDLKAGKEECFNILTENQDGQRELVVDANKASVSGVVPVDVDVECLLYAGEAQSPETMEARGNRIAGVETPGRVLCFSEIVNDRVSCFCEGGGLVTVYDKANVVIVDGAPDLTSMFTLPNGLVVCFADDGPVYVVRPPDPGSVVKQWKDLLIFEMERVTHLDSIVFDSGQLLMLSGMDVIQLTNQGDWGSDDAICDIGADMHLVCCHHDHMVATSRDESCSRLLKSASGQICEDQRTLHILFKNKKLYQVTPMGVYTNKKPEVSFACSAKLASSCDNGKTLCVVFEDNSVTCYRGNQTSTLDILKGSVTACDVSSDFVVVAVFMKKK